MNPWVHLPIYTQVNQLRRKWLVIRKRSRMLRNGAKMMQKQSENGPNTPKQSKNVPKRSENFSKRSENNLFSSHMDLNKRQPSPFTSRFAKANLIKHKIIDGNDISEVICLLLKFLVFRFVPSDFGDLQASLQKHTTKSMKIRRANGPTAC